MNRFLIIAFTLIGCLRFAYGQQTDPRVGFTYQALAIDRSQSEGFGRDTQGKVLANQDVKLRFNIRGGVEGTIEYQEIHETTTDAFGIFRLVIGRGETSSNVLLEELNWGQTVYFLEIEIDLGDGFQALGAEELHGAPFALNTLPQKLSLNDNELSITRGNMIQLEDNDSGNELLEDASLNGSILELTDAGGTKMVDLSSIIASDSDPTNEIQDLSTDGSTGNISISDGSTITINVDDADANDTNEIQDLALNGNILTITNNTSATPITLNDDGAFSTDSNVTSNSPGDLTSDDFVFGSPQLDADGNPDHYNRMFFDKSKAAFRAGSSANDEWDEENIGDFSFAAGTHPTASGFGSIALGSVVASGKFSFAQGVITYARSFAETALGTFNTDYVPESGIIFKSRDRLLVIGNGNLNAQSDALVMLKDGSTTLNGQLTIDGDNIGGADGYTLPAQDGTANQAMITDGNGILSWGSTGAGAFSTTTNVTSNAPGDYANDDFVFGSPQLDDDGDPNHDARMFFDKSKGAFRAGQVDDDKWDTRGDYSVAMGFQTVAEGEGSFAVGWGTTASGFVSTATGRATTASGNSSTAMGYSTAASGNISTAMGALTVAEGEESFAVGLRSKATGSRSTAMGSDTKALADYSTAMGANTTASGFYSTSMGFFTTASGSRSTAMGANTTASGSFSTAMGEKTTAIGSRSTAMGNKTTASGSSSTAMGTNTTASGDYSISMGYYTAASGNNSTTMGSSTTASGTNSTAMGRQTVAEGDGSFAVGFLTTASGSNSTAMGALTAAEGEESFAVGLRSKATGAYSAAMGTDTKALADYSTAMGSNTTASGWFSISMGYFTTASGSNSTAMGRKTTASGSRSTAMGEETTALGSRSTAMGIKTTASGSSSTAMGSNTTASGDYSISMGYYTAASGNNSTAMGYYTAASGNNSTTMGSSTTASGSNSTAMGRQTVAEGDGSFAMGFLTTASGSNSTAMGSLIFSRSFSETAIGLLNTDYTPNSATAFDSNDRLFTIGNGTDDSNRSNAFVLLKNGNATLSGTLTETSDARLKKDISPITDSYARIMDMKGVNFRWNNVKPHDTTSLQTGFIAQDVEKLFPDLVREDSEGYKSVNYIGVIPHLVEAIKVLKSENEELKNELVQKNRDQVNKLDELETRLRILENKSRSKKHKITSLKAKSRNE